MIATSTAIEPESAKKTCSRPAGVSATSRSASRTAGAWVSPPNMTCGIASSCALTAAAMCGWLCPWQAHHHELMPSMTRRPSASVSHTPSARSTSSAGRAAGSVA